MLGEIAVDGKRTKHFQKKGKQGGPLRELDEKKKCDRK